MAPTDVGALCRLCTKRKELLWVFNDKLKTSENFKDVIAITTGVEIKTDDDGPSQFVCKKCLECAIRMYQFRIRAQQSNKFVIEEYENRLMTIAAPSVPQTSQVKVHSTVTALLKIYPTINVPSGILKRDVLPSVSLPMNFVEDYFRTRNLNMDEAVRAAEKSMRKRPKSPFGSKAVKGKERKEKGEGFDTKSGGPVSPINIKLNSSGPSYQMVEKDLEKKMDPSGITMKNYTESLGLLPTETNTTPSTHEKKEPADVLEEKPTKKRKKKKTLFEQTMRILDQVQRSRKRPELYESPAKKQKIEEPTRKEIEHGDKGQKGEKLTVITKSPEGTLGDVSREQEFENVPLEPIIDKFRPENFDEPIELIMHKQEESHMCNICNVTQFDRRCLKRHMQRHMRCPFCKKRFKSFKSTDKHIKQICPISTSMTNLPDVWLDRVEFDRCSREKYLSAFEGYFPTVEEKESGKVVKKIAAFEDAASSKRPEDVIVIFDDIPRNKPWDNPKSCSVIVPTIQLKNPRHHEASSNGPELDMFKALISKDVSSSSSSQTMRMDDVLNVKEGSHIRMSGLKSQARAQDSGDDQRRGDEDGFVPRFDDEVGRLSAVRHRKPDGFSALPMAPPAVTLEKAGKKIVPVKIATTTATCIAGLNVFATPFVPVVMTTASSNLLTTQAVMRSISSSIVATTDPRVANAAHPVATSTSAPGGYASGAGIPVMPPETWNCDLNGQIEGIPPSLISLSEAIAKDVVLTAGASIPTNASPKSAELLKTPPINRTLKGARAPKQSRPKPSPPKLSPPESPIPTSSYSKPYLTNSLCPKLPLPHSSFSKPYLRSSNPNPPKSSLPKTSHPNPPLPKMPFSNPSPSKTSLANSSVSKPPLRKPSPSNPKPSPSNPKPSPSNPKPSPSNSKPSHPNPPLSKACPPKPFFPKPSPSNPNPTLSKTSLPNSLVSKSPQSKPPSNPNPSLSRTSLPNSLVSKPLLPKPPSNPNPSLSKTSLPNSLVSKPSLPKPSQPNPSLSTTSLPNASALKSFLSRSSPSNPKPFHPNPSVPKTALPDPSLPKTSFPGPSVPKPSPPNETMPSHVLNSVYGMHDRRTMYKNGAQFPALPYQPPKTTETRQIVLNSHIKMAPVTADNGGSTSGTASSGSTSSGYQMATVNDATKTQSHTANGVIKVKDVWELK